MITKGCAVKTPEGTLYNLYRSVLKQPHVLIAGATGSGKSVIINGLIATALYRAPSDVGFVLIDPKRVELVSYRDLPHTLKYTSEPDDMLAALKYAVSEVERRYKTMQTQAAKKYSGGDIYVILDELADLMCTDKKHVMPLIQRLCQIGRAANVHVIAATQCPLAKVIPTEIKVNFDARVGLRTRSAQDSRNILGFNGCEKLPRFGYGYVMLPGYAPVKVEIPLVSDDEIRRLVDHWINQYSTAAQYKQNFFSKILKRRPA